MRSRRVLPIIVVAIHIAACGSQQHSLTATAAANLRGRQLVTAVPKPDAFLPRAETLPPGLLFGALRLARLQAEGDRIRRENGIADPAQLIAQELGDYLKHRYGARLVPLQVPAGWEDPTYAAIATPSVDLVLEVQTDSWSLVPYPHSLGSETKYGVRYMAKLRLIETKSVPPTGKSKSAASADAARADGVKMRFRTAANADGAGGDRANQRVQPADERRGDVIARGTCIYSRKETPSSPTNEEYLADGARQLIYELDLATVFCIDEFRSKVLTPASPP